MLGVIALSSELLVFIAESVEFDIEVYLLVSERGWLLFFPFLSS